MFIPPHLRLTSHTRYVPFPNPPRTTSSQENYEAGFKESARIFFEREERKVCPGIS